MKLYTKGTIILLACVALSYSSCKKDSAPASNPQTTTQSAANASVAGLVAVNLTQSLSGSFGGPSITDGLSPRAMGSMGPDGSAALCGFVADSTINYKTNVGDSIQTTVTGATKFYFNCTNGQPTGYTLNGEQLSVGTGPGYSFSVSLCQGYCIKMVDTCTLFNVNGSLKAYKDITYTNPACKPTSEHDGFVLTNCEIDISNKGAIKILSGTAVFTTVGSNSSGSWNYTGTLEFLGNNIGKMTFEGNVFTINLLTGKTI